MATYAGIEEFIRESYGISVKGCWIAHVKELCGLRPERSPNRIDRDSRTNPCPPDKVEVSSGRSGTLG